MASYRFTDQATSQLLAIYDYNEPNSGPTKPRLIWDELRSRLEPDRFDALWPLTQGRQLDAPDAAGISRRFTNVVEPVSDHSGSSAYRKHLIGELTRRTIERACQQALETA